MYIFFFLKLLFTVRMTSVKSYGNITKETTDSGLTHLIKYTSRGHTTKVKEMSILIEGVDDVDENYMGMVLKACFDVVRAHKHGEIAIKILSNRTCYLIELIEK